MRRLLLGLALFSSAHRLPGQATPLPDAPRPQAETATLTGNIVDIHGDPVVGASVTLVGPKGANLKVIESAADGTFNLPGLIPETVRLTVTARGMEPFVSAEIRLTPGEKAQVPEIVLPIAPANTEVTVNATQEQVAEAQLNGALHQRALAVFPNFYTSFIWDAAPLNFRQKSRLAFRSMTDPAEFGVVAIRAAYEQEKNKFPDYGDGPAGFFRRYGAGYGDAVISRFFGGTVYPSLFRQDPRYFYMGSGTVKHRAAYAISTAVIQKGNNGRFQPAYSRILGSVTAGAISYSYRPSADRGVGLIFQNVGYGIAGQAITSLVREFVLRKVSTGVPDYENGKPVSEKKVQPKQTATQP